ncbi:snare associated Golgi protein-domain-containing protein [Zopfochytrium polystomum]|nr:snare associated Golgi protein-domain-containing protein [Zopfochytrium polystomum]
MAAGVIFRPVVVAIVLVLLGSQLGLLMSVVLGRTVLRPWVEGRIRKDQTLSAIDRAISKEGAKIVILLRLSPIAPFGLANYILSATSIPYPLLALSTFVGNLPGSISGSVVGSFLSSLSGASDYKISPRAQYLGMLFSGVFAVLSIVYISLLARKALREAIAEGAARAEGLPLQVTPGSSQAGSEDTPRRRSLDEAFGGGGTGSVGRRRAVSPAHRRTGAAAAAGTLPFDSDLESGLLGDSSDDVTADYGDGDDDDGAGGGGGADGSGLLLPTTTTAAAAAGAGGGVAGAGTGSWLTAGFSAEDKRTLKTTLVGCIAAVVLGVPIILLAT